MRIPMRGSAMDQPAAGLQILYEKFLTVIIGREFYKYI
jgi:hypothetical protein